MAQRDGEKEKIGKQKLRSYSMFMRASYITVVLLTTTLHTEANVVIPES